jgi:V8-like Glu-specific endopeptidase
VRFDDPDGGPPIYVRGSVIQGVSKEFLHHKRVNVSGYPRCDPQFHETYQQWASADVLTEVSLSDASGAVPQWIGYGADARHATSGGPIWIRSADGTRNLIGIHIMAGRRASTGACLNFGIHLNHDVWSEIAGWL